jgi:hypothetical protein
MRGPIPEDYGSGLICGIGDATEAGMPQTAFQVHKVWLIRAVLVLVITALADGVVVWFAQRPLFWAVLIGSSLPFSMMVFVALPVLREESRKSSDR